MSLQNSNAVCEKTSSSTYPLEKDIVSHSALDRELAGADSVKRRKCIFAGEDGDVTTDPSPALSFQMARMGSFSCGLIILFIIITYHLFVCSCMYERDF
jgi:hypothetical protein